MKPETLHAFQLAKVFDRLPDVRTHAEEVEQVELDTPDGPRFVRFVKVDFMGEPEWALQMRVFKSKMRNKR